MTKAAKWIFLAVLGLGFIGNLSNVEGKVIIAASCNNTSGTPDIQTAINAAVSGDTILVPAGLSCVWTSPWNVPTTKKNCLLKGAGAGNTIVTITVGGSGGNTLNASNLSITGFTFKSTGAGGWFTVYGSTSGKMRVWNNEFINVTAGGGYTFWEIGWNAAGPNETLMVFDHNVMRDGKLYMHGDLGNGKGDTSWAEPEGFGTFNATYVEDNDISFTAPSGGCLDGQYGGRYVARFNKVNGCSFEAHAAQNGRATRSWEIYFNTWTGQGAQGLFPTLWRGGTGLFFGNDISTGYNIANSITVDNIRNVTDFVSPFGKCDGSSLWDENSIPFGSDGGGYRCRDSIGVGRDAKRMYQDYQTFVASGTIPGGAGGYTAAGTVLLSTTMGTYSQVLVGIDGSGLGGGGTTLLIPDNVAGGEVCFESSVDGSVWAAQLLNGVSNWYLVGKGSMTFIDTVTNPFFRLKLCGQATMDSSTMSFSPYVRLALYPFPEQEVTPAAFFLNTRGGARARVALTLNDSWKWHHHGADYQEDFGVFTGTSGVGVGSTIADAPATCTQNVYFWAKNEGAWNAGTNSIYTGQGRLYRCTATDVWTLYYTPYTYPHPLAYGRAVDMGGNGVISGKAQIKKM